MSRVEQIPSVARRRFAVLVVVVAVSALPGRAAAPQSPTATAATAAPLGDRVLTLTAEPLVGGVGGVAVDRAGMIYTADFRETVYKIAPDGRVSVFATGLYGASGNAIDSRGNLLQANFYGDYITRIDRHGNQEVFADTGLAGPVGVAVDPGDNVYVCNCRGNSISRITAWGVVEEFAKSDLLNCPNGITRAPDGSFFIVNFSDGLMLRLTADGTLSEFATIPGGGNGHVAFTRGNLYATGFQGQRIYRISLAGEVTHIAGTGAFGETDGAALQATFTFPNGIAVSPQGDRLYINDFLNRSAPTMAIPPVPMSSIRIVKLASLTDDMMAALQTQGVPAMIEVHRAWKTSRTTSAVFTETDVNALGYRVMGTGQTVAAIEIFKLNVDAYPNSWNVYDSLGEAYMAAGDNDKAIEAYEASVARNPGNTNGVAMLKKLRGGR